MTEWLPGPIFMYIDPDSEPDGDPGKSGRIASVQYPYTGGERPAAFILRITHDLAQAERWRSALAAGRWPTD